MSSVTFTHLPHPNLVAEDVRTAAIADPAFGRVFTDHMVSIRYTEGQGWHDAQVMPRGPLTLDPATAVLHYAQEIFEGLKAYRLDDGSMALFRVEANAARFNASARRMAMAEMPEELFIAAVKEAVAADAAWFPPVDGGALYFIARQPGLTISDLLALLGITKQSLGRVVKELEARAMLTTRPGNRDRRQKELRLTEAGRTIEAAIFVLLRDTMSRAYTHAGQQAVTGFWHVSEALVPASERKRIAALGKDVG